ncbi:MULTISPECIES: hypothetical protein [unclassified Streptomyces]|uniref:hypothetical protein n=1 Tax=unclassified Streptomyces TaxID=2593676 RepID=UPI00382A0538
MYTSSSSVFTSVNRHFDEPQVSEAVSVTVSTDADGATVQLTAAQAYEALHGPASSPAFAAAVWKAALHAALTDQDPQGSRKLLVIWLILPELSGTVRRICARLRTDRSDVESEIILAVLEGLAALDGTGHVSDSSLIDAARTRAWRFARDGLREFSSPQAERIAQDQAVDASGGHADAEPEEYLEVQVDREQGTDGLHAAIRFRVRPEHLRKGALPHTATGAREHSTRRSRCDERQSGRRVGSRSVHPTER